jgi:RHS repeat-associated protein
MPDTHWLFSSRSLSPLAGRAKPARIFNKLKICRRRVVSRVAIFLTLVVATPLLSFSSLYSQEFINPSSGRLSLTATDLVLRTGSVNLELQRFLLPRQSERGMLGTRWRLNWESRLLHTGPLVLIEETTETISFARDTSNKVEFTNVSGERIVFEESGRAIRSRTDGTKDVFDREGRLVERDLGNGNKIRLHFDASNRLSRIEGPYGSAIYLISDSDGRVTQVKTSTGATVRYGYTIDYLSEVEISDRATLRYSYDGTGRLAQIDDPQSGPVKLEYDSQDRVVSRRWADGAQERYEYGSGNLTRHIDTSGAVTVTQRDQGRQEVTDPLGRRSVIQYDFRGQPVKVTGPTGASIGFTYDALGRTTSIKDSFGRETRFEYLRNSSLVTAVGYPNGSRQVFDYDSALNLTSIKRGGETVIAFTYHPDGNVKSLVGAGQPELALAYDAKGRLKSVTDALRQTTQFEYDDRGNQIARIDSSGMQTTWKYDARDRVTSVTRPEGGGTTRYEYEPSGLLSRLIDPMGAITHYEYDARGRLVSITDPANRKTRYEHDSNGRITSATDAIGAIYRFEYDKLGNVIRETNPSGGVVHRQYDALSRVTSLTDASGGTTRYEYAPSGLLSRLIDPMGAITHYEYDARGRLVSITDPANRKTRYQYDGATDYPVTEIDPVGRITRYEYDTQGRLAKLLPPNGRVETYGYDNAGNLVSASRNGEVIFRHKYDSLGRPIEQVDPNGLALSYHYDPSGQLSNWRDSLGGGGTIQYDATGRPVAITDPAGATTRYRYDLVGNLLIITDPVGQAKKLAYSATGQLTEVTEPSGDRAKYDYDAMGRLTAVQHPGGGVTKFSYDTTGNPLTITDHLGQQVRHLYDKAGRLIRTTDAKGQNTAYTYDLAGRLIQKQLGDGKIVRYRYDVAGKLTELDDGLFPIRYGYDLDGNLTAIQYPALKKSLSYEYNDDGLLAKFIDSEGQAIRYEYDSASRLSAIRSAQGDVTFNYDAKDRLTTVVYPNGVKGTWEYDTTGRPIRIAYTSADGKILNGWSYKYDEAGNRIETRDAEGKTVTYRYDPSGQLVEQNSGAGGAVRYSYLPGGNRAKRESAGTAIEYRYDLADRLLQAGDETFAYDANGNLIERRNPRGVTRYDYDAEDRLAKVVLPGGEEVSFGYAPTGERIWQRDSSGVTFFVTDGLHRLADLDKDLRPKASYIHGPGIDRPLIMSRNSQSYSYHADVLGSVASLTDHSGGVAQRYNYDAFGMAAGQRTDAENPIGFTGREWDSSTGLYYYRARYYDPMLGRFLMPDPHAGMLLDLGTLNRYSYVGNDPVNFVDPLGDARLPAGKPPHITDRARLRPPFGGRQPRIGSSSPRSVLQPPLSVGKEEPLSNWIKGQRRPAELRDVPKLPCPPYCPQPRHMVLPERPSALKSAVQQAEPRLVIDPEELNSEWHTLGKALARAKTESRITDWLDENLPRVGKWSRKWGKWIAGKLAMTGGAIVSGAGYVASGVNYEACREEGHSDTDCVQEAVVGAAVGAVVGRAVVGGLAKGATAVVGAPAVAAAAPFVAVGGVVYGGYKAGERWANAPEVEAEARLRSQQESNLGALQETVDTLARTIDQTINPLKAQVIAARNATKERASEAGRNATEAAALLEKLKASEAKVSSASQACTEVSALTAQVSSHADSARREGDTISSDLQRALSMAANCQTRTDAQEISRIYQDAKIRFVKVNLEAGQAKAAYDRLLEIRNQARAAKASLNDTRGIAGKIAELASNAESALQATGTEVAKAEERKRQLEVAKDSIIGRIVTTRGAFPENHPEVKAKFQELIGRAEATAQLPGEDVSGYIVTAQDHALRARNLASQAQALFAAMENASLCDGLDLAEDTLAKADAGNTLAAFSLDRSADLPQKASMCLARLEQRKDPNQGQAGGADWGGSVTRTEEPSRSPAPRGGGADWGGQVSRQDMPPAGSSRGGPGDGGSWPAEPPFGLGTGSGFTRDPLPPEPRGSFPEDERRRGWEDRERECARAFSDAMAAADYGQFGESYGALNYAASLGCPRDRADRVNDYIQQKQRSLTPPSLIPPTPGPWPPIGRGGFGGGSGSMPPPIQRGDPRGGYGGPQTSPGGPGGVPGGRSPGPPQQPAVCAQLGRELQQLGAQQNQLGQQFSRMAAQISSYRGRAPQSLLSEYQRVGKQLQMNEPRLREIARSLQQAGCR